MITPVKVLINTTELNRNGGGVCSYYRTLRPYLPSTVEYFTVGPRSFAESVWKRFRRFISDYFSFFHLLRGNDFDIVHLNPSFGITALVRDGLFLLLAKALGRKAVVFIHGWDVRCENRMRTRWLWLFRGVYFRADAFLVLAEEFQNKLLDMGCKTPIFHETTTVDDAVFGMADVTEEKSRCANCDFNILYLSRVEQAKGIFEALDAFAIVKQKHVHVSLTVAGDGGALRDAKKHAAEQGLEDVSFLGYVRGAEKHSVLGNANCCLLPTHGEGMPISVLEAMACGLPVVTRPVGGLKDFFEDGRMGYLVESLAPSAIAEAVDKLITAPEMCETMGRYNREYARERFAASSVASRLMRVYEHVV